MANIEDLARLESVIADNANLNGALAQPHIFPKAREKITRIFDLLDAPQQNVFLSLVSRYSIHFDYGRIAYNLVPRIFDLYKTFNKVSLCTPYIDAPKNQKSAGLITYEIRAQLVAHDVPKSRVSIRDVVPNDVVDGPLIVVDDFSGSGRTIRKAVERLLVVGYKPENISVSVLYAMRDAIQCIEALGVRVDAALSGTRCLTEYEFSEAEGGAAAPEIYGQIEAKLGVTEENVRGFGQTEALVSMKATPNNTLPIFWYKGKKGVGWPCPFPR
ncbi:hypothetical protein [Brevundimonas sp.]|uniref:phosphoribosyltransferase-like protein n=1 Tax=Brevundimonas sp. TaxID=1871086 RepID=UPI0035AEEE5E